MTEISRKNNMCRVSNLFGLRIHHYLKNALGKLIMCKICMKIYNKIYIKIHTN